MGSKLSVMDNTTAVEARCIKILDAGQKKHGRLGDKILVVVTKILLTQKILIQKGKMHRGIVVRIKGWSKRKNQFARIRFKENNVVLVNKKWSPIGRRLEGPIPQEIGWEFIYIGSINNGVV